MKELSFEKMENIDGGVMDVIYYLFCSGGVMATRPTYSDAVHFALLLANSGTFCTIVAGSYW